MTDILWEIVLSFLEKNSKHLLFLAVAVMVFFVAVKAIRKKIETQPKKQAVWWCSLFLVITLFFTFLVSSATRVTAYFYLYYGLKCLYEHKHDHAYEEFLEAHRLDPSNGHILDRLAFAAYSSKDFSVARKWFDKLERINVSYDMGIYHGHVLLMTGEPERAKEILEASSKHASKPAFAFFYLGDYYRFKKDYEQARTNYEKALELTGLHKNFVRMHMAGMYQEIGDHEKAKELLRFVADNPGSEETLSQSARKILDKYAEEEDKKGESDGQ